MISGPDDARTEPDLAKREAAVKDLHRRLEQEKLKLAEREAAMKDLYRRLEQEEHTLAERVETVERRETGIEGLKVFGVAAVVVVGLALIGALFWTFVAATDVDGSERIGLVQAGVGGMAAIVIGVIAAWRARSLQRQVEVTQARLDEDRSRTELEVASRRRERLDKQFGEAAKLIGHDKVHVTIAGLLALERLLQSEEFREEHWTIIQLLEAFVMGRCSEPSGDPKKPKLPPDAQVALSIIGRRPMDRDEPRRLNLSRAHLEGADLHGARLQRANLVGTRLQGAGLQGADLQGAALRHTRLQGADLEGANFEGANLHGARLRGAHLERTNLQGLRLAGNLQGADFEGADLRGARFGGSLAHVNFAGANLQAVRFAGAHLRCQNFEGANLQGANFEGADLYGANFEGADLDSANFEGAYLQGAHLEGAVGLGYQQLLKAKTCPAEVLERLRDVAVSTGREPKGTTHVECPL